MRTTGSLASRVLVKVLGFCAAVGISCLCSVCFAEVRYELTDIGSHDGWSSRACGVNKVGDVVGWGRTADNHSYPFLWQGGVIKNLGTLGGLDGVAYDINRVGQVVGYSKNASGYERAFLWQNNVMKDLGTLGGTQSTALAINDLGQVAGYSLNASGYYHAFLWQNDVMTDLGALSGMPYSRGYGINSLGRVVGLVDAGGMSSTRAVLWAGGGPSDLGTLGGPNASAGAINDFDQIVGSAETAGSGNWAQPFLWENGQMKSLGMLPGSSRGGAYDINNVHQVVGWEDAGPVAAFLWENGQISDLNSLIAPGSGFSLYEAIAISDTGLIVGWGKLAGNIGDRAFLLTPVPEPGTLALLALGGLLAFRRRR